MSLLDWQLLAFVLLFAYLAMTLFARITASMTAWRCGKHAALLVVVTSPVLLLLLGHYAENRPWSDFTDLGTMPWSVVFGDGIVLPLAVLVAASSASYWHDKELSMLPRWHRLAGLIGLAAGTVFHLWDAANYRKGGYGALTGAVTKMWHDFGVYSILFGMIVWVSPLVFKYASRAYKLAFLGLLLVQLTLMIIDANRGLDPAQMHTACNLACGSNNLAGHLHDVLYWLLGKA